jgi:hypothetical protein
MFRTLYRVLVVSAVALSLAVLFTPVAQARPIDSGAPAAVAQRNLLDEAISWLSNLLAHAKQSEGKTMTAITAHVASSGPCIDPWGRERPCP